jgi:hypothetical protein
MRGEQSDTCEGKSHARVDASFPSQEVHVIHHGVTTLVKNK